MKCKNPLVGYKYTKIQVYSFDVLKYVSVHKAKHKNMVVSPSRPTQPNGRDPIFFGFEGGNNIVLLRNGNLMPC